MEIDSQHPTLGDRSAHKVRIDRHDYDLKLGRTWDFALVFLNSAQTRRIEERRAWLDSAPLESISHRPLSETFDQIGLFFPRHDLNPSMGSRPEGPDYGVFDFVGLFARALCGKSFGALSKAQKKSLRSKFEHKVSDHMPLWLRLPLPR